MQIMAVIRETFRSLGAFIVVGLTSTLVHYIVLKTLLTTGLVSELWLANVLAFFCGLIISYSGNYFFVFEKRRGHAAAFGFLLSGYSVALLVNTSVLVGLAEGGIFNLLRGPLADFGGKALMDLWQGLIGLVPFLGTSETVATTPAFIVATGISASMTYLWNRFVVFQSRVRLNEASPSEAPKKA